MSIEVEIRGPLDTESLNMLRSILEKKGTQIYQSKDIALFFPENKSLGIKQDQLRLKVNNKEEKIVFKDNIGNELELKLQKDEIITALRLFKILNFSKVSLAPAKRIDFSYENAVFSIKTDCIIGNHYELERLIEKEDEIAKVKNGLINLAKKLNLKVWTEEEYRKQRKESWKKIRKLGIEEAISLLAQSPECSSSLIDQIIK